MTILTRLREASTGSRELDAEIEIALHDGIGITQSWVKTKFPKWEKMQTVGCVRAVADSGESAANWSSARYTTSIDAALGLVERMLPGWFYTVASAHTDYNMRPWADVAAPTFTDDGEYYSSDGATPSLAILAALFTALEAKEGE